MSARPEPGSVLGSYRLLRLIGRGGRASVFEGVHVHNGIAAAVKVLDPGPVWDAAAETRLLRQAESIARLRHPNLVEIIAFGHDRGSIYLVMPLLRGEDLAAAIGQAPQGLDPASTADTMIAVCAAVFAAHGERVLHRNLKASKVLLTRSDGGEGVPRVLDFGVAGVFPATDIRTLAGSLGPHLAPEQVRGDAIDERTDGYALGVILYQCLAGRLPHAGESTFALMKSISAGQPRPPRSLRPELPAELEAVVMRALATRPDERFRSVRELGQALLPFASPRARELGARRFAPPAATIIGYRVEPAGARENTERLARLPPARRRRPRSVALFVALTATVYFAFGLRRNEPSEAIEIPTVRFALPPEPAPAPPPIPPDLPPPAPVLARPPIVAKAAKATKRPKPTKRRSSGTRAGRGKSRRR